MNVVFLKFTMMKSVIANNAVSEAKEFWTWWQARMQERNLDFKEQSKPRTSSQAEEPAPPGDGNEDYTSEKELKELFAKMPIPKDHVMQFEILLNLSAEDFYKQYWADGCPHPITQFIESRGEQKIEMKDWTDPTGEEAKYSDLTVQKIKIVSAEYQIKNNPFVKVAPTVKNCKLIKQTPDHFHLR